MFERVGLLVIVLPLGCVVVLVALWLGWPESEYRDRTTSEWAEAIESEVRELEREAGCGVTELLLSGLSFRSVGMLEGSHPPSAIHGPPCDSVATLAMRGSESAGVIADLLRDSEPTVRAVAASIVARRGRDVAGDELEARRADLRSLLEDGSPLVRRSALLALGAVGESSEDGPRAVTLVLDPDPRVRSAACWAIGNLEPPAAVSVQTLSEMLGDDSADVRRAAALALSWYGAEALPALPALILALEDDDTWVLAAVLEALGAIGPDARAAIPALLARSDRLTTRVVRALGRIADPRARGALLEAAEASGVEVRQTALAGLGRLSRLEPDLVDVLLDRVTDENVDIRRHACAVLRTLPPGSASPRAATLLRAATEDPDVGVRIQAAMAVAKYVGDPAPAVDVLVEVLRTEEEWGPAHLAASLLVELGEAARRAIPEIEEIIRTRRGSIGDMLDRRLQDLRRTEED